MKNKKPLIVYWSPFTTLLDQYSHILLDLEPVSLKSYILKSKPVNPKIPFPIFEKGIEPGGYHICSAMNELVKNIFIIKAPFSCHVDLDQNGNMLDSSTPFDFFEPRISSFENSLNVDLILPYIFFSEESLDLTITPPYMTRTVQQSYGFLAAVKFNIGKWFRPMIMTYHLWPGIFSLYIEKNEPIMYLNFNTDRPVILKQFKLNDHLLSQAQACMKDKKFHTLQPMNLLYDRFIKTKMNKIVLKEIKENLID
jgi:hypothetical protein